MIDIHQCTKGTIVRETCGFRIGHIVGFGRNSVGELCLNIAWDDGQTYLIHPGNVELIDESTQWEEFYNENR